jgi:membrane-bound lytic murein transglycosylase D
MCASLAAQPANAPSSDELFQLGRELFEQFAPAEIKAQFEFPSKADWDQFAARLQAALESDDLRALAAYAPEGRAALAALRAFPEYSDYADWLSTRLDEIEAAEQITATSPSPAPVPRSPAPPGPVRSRPTAPGSSAAIPHYDLWLARVGSQPSPARAAALIPRLRAAFAAERVPPELVWLAEAESSFNPSARSPVGARGLFQLMPETAKEQGLGVFLPDDRTDPEKSARAAARLLRGHYQRFGSWPLAIAAYNAGPGRVSRLLEKSPSKTYAAIASSLPAETRMYVPKVCALVTTRAGVTPDKIPAPRS